MVDNVRRLQTRASATPEGKIEGIVIAQLERFEADGDYVFSVPSLRLRELHARHSLVPITAAAIGRPMAVAFEQGDVTRAVVMGLMHQSATATASELRTTPAMRTSSPELDVSLA